MGSLFMAVILAVVAIVALAFPVPEIFTRVKRIVGVSLIVLAAAIGIMGGVSYNDAGFCVHNRTAFGAETAKCDLGWYFSGWGQTTEWAHYITVSHTTQPTENSVTDLPAYPIRMADNWSGLMTQTTRFGIPQDPEQFLKMARDFRSPERLVVTTLRPAVTSSLDSVANLYTMEEYWSQGKRDEFKTEFENAVKKGRPAIDRTEVITPGVSYSPNTAPSSSPNAADTAETGGPDSTRVVTTKRLDKDGAEIRIPHEYIDYGIVISSAIVENLDPDNTFEDRIQERKEAASRRIIAREKRLEEEEQRLLAITKAEREIAQKQGEARVVQIEKTTNAETAKRLAVTASEQIREQAKITKETETINLDTARIQAENVKLTADASAYERTKLLEADNALQIKLNAEVDIQKVWADAYARRNVPGIVLGGGGVGGAPTGSDSEVTQLMKLLTVDAARRLNYQRTLEETAPKP